LVGLTVVAPGSAQMIAGNRRFGKTVLQVWAGVVVAVALIAWRVPMDTLASLAVRPWLLTTFKVLAFGVALAWIALLVDAWRLGHPPGLTRKHRLIVLGTTLALIGLVATPFIVAARYASAAHDAVVSMFPSGQVAAASDGRLNILLLGADAGDGREGNRPDSIHVVSLDVRTGRPVLVSLPRNLEKARFPSGTPMAEAFPRGFSGDGDRSNWMLNATWTYGVANPEMFPGTDEPGPVAVMQAVEGTLGIPIHYYLTLDLQAFTDLVDAVGGVTINVERDLPIGERGRVLEAGVRKLSGYETLWYTRSRTGSDDYDRMARQRCAMGAMLQELDPGTVLQNFLALVEASASLVKTNIPHQQLPDLVEAAWQAKDVPMTSLQLVPPLIIPADPDVNVIADEVQAAFASSLADEPADAAGDESADDADGADGADAGAAASGDDAEPAAAASGGDADEAAGERAEESPSVDVAEVCATP
jgi:LCP family protein required for cell wall assembly